MSQSSQHTALSVPVYSQNITTNIYGSFQATEVKVRVIAEGSFWRTGLAFLEVISSSIYFFYIFRKQIILISNTFF